MSALSEDELADLARTLAALEEELRSAHAGRDAAVEQRTAATLEQFRLQTELRAALDRQKASAEILRSIAATSGNAEHALRQIAETTAHFFNAPSVTICIAEGDRWVQDIRVGSGSLASGAHPSSPQIASGASLPATVYQENRQIHIPDLDNIDPSMAHWPAVATRAVGIRTLSGTPLRRDGGAIGALIIYRDRLAPFTDEELALQQSFADQAVIAIENARLFNETQEALARQTATAEILRVISGSPTNVQPVFDTIVRTAVRLLGCDRVFFMRVDGNTYTPVAGVNRDGPAPLGTPNRPIDPAANFPSRAITTKQMLHLPDWSQIELPEHERAIHERFGVESALYLPLLRGEDCIGLLILIGSRPNLFGDKEVALAESFRDQALIAIENTRLFNETKEALERQTATSDILKVIASSPSDTRPVFEAIVASANRLLGGFSSTVYRFIEGQAYLEAFTPTTPQADAILTSTFPLPVDRFAPFEIAQAGEVTQIEDTEILTGEILAIARARGFRSMLFAPLVNKGRSIGIVVVTRGQTGTFADHHVQLLKTFADQAVIAIENARLFDEVQAKTRDLEESLQQQTATADVLKVISRSAFDLNTVMNTLADSARTLCGSKTANLFLRDGGMLVCRGSAAVKPEDEDFMKANPVELNDETHMGRAVLDGTVANIGDFVSNPHTNLRKFQQAMGFKSFLAVPLMREGRGIGVFTLSRDELGPFSQRQVELVQGFADQAVIAIENVRLFDEVQARTRELSKSLDDLRKAQDRLVQTEKLASLGQLTAGIAHEIKNPLNFVNNFSALSIELADELNDLLKQATLADKLRDDVDELTNLLKDNLDKVVQHGKRADSIVKNMLLHSREGSGEHRPSDVNALVEESLNLAYHGARAEKPQFNVNLQRDFDPEAGMIEVFPQEITRVLLNLISNGFYAVTKRKADNGSDGFEPLVTASTKGSSSHVEIRIRDNGIGIPPDVKEKMFNPFFTTKPAGEGTGLGLSMSHDIIVKQHGGTIDVDTEPGAFTEFTIVLPRTKK